MLRNKDSASEVLQHGGRHESVITILRLMSPYHYQWEVQLDFPSYACAEVYGHEQHHVRTAVGSGSGVCALSSQWFLSI